MSGNNIISYEIQEKNEVFTFEKTGKYKKICNIGEGSFGKVILVKKMDDINLENSNTFALKICKKYQVEVSKDSENKRPNEILMTEIKELQILKQVRNIENPYLIKCIDWTISEENQEIMILMEYFPVELSTFFHKNLGNIKIINENLFKNIAFQMLSGIDALHKNGIIHCDIKPQNILYDPSQNYIQLTDYGLSNNFDYDIDTDFKGTGGTYPYMAPDLLLGNTFFFISLDIWSLGCVFVELCTGEVIFSGDNYQDVLEKIVDVFGSIKDLLPGFKLLARNRKVTLIEKEGKGLINYIKENQKFEFSNEHFYDLITKMLCIDPFKRITAEDAMKHSFFTNCIN